MFEKQLQYSLDILT